MKMIGQLCLIFATFIFVSFFSMNMANGLMYPAIFVSNLSRKKYMDPLTILLISIFLDIYSFAFVGISQSAIAVFYILSSKYRPAFPNFKINAGYLFLFLCCSKLLSFVMVNFLGYGYDISSNGMQIFWALLIYWIYYFSQNIYDGMSNA
jgi:hypothetical protein